MSLVDQFESLFRSADRRRYEYSRPEVRSVLVITDLGKTAADALVSDLRHFLVEVAEGAWTVLDDGSYGDVGELLDTVNAAKPDLIVSYRNLRNDDWRWPYSLGSYLNVLLRETDYPVLVVPNPHELPDLRLGDRSTERVMVLADHLTGDHRLVNYGARFTRPEGKLHLVHVEDDQTFERYIDVIGKIPAIDTDIAREDIKERLLKEPKDYIDSCREVLAAQGHLTHEVIPAVTLGHRLADYVALIEERGVDLLVFHAVEQETLAMAGKAYSLAVRLRSVPLLMV